MPSYDNNNLTLSPDHNHDDSLLSPTSSTIEVCTEKQTSLFSIIADGDFQLPMPENPFYLDSKTDPSVQQKKDQNNDKNYEQDETEKENFEDWSKKTNFSFVLKMGSGRLAGMAAPKEFSDYKMISREAHEKMILMVNLLPDDEQKELQAKKKFLPIPDDMENISALFVPIEEKMTLSKELLCELIDKVKKYLASGGLVVVHCRHGINRTGMILAHVVTQIYLDNGICLSNIQKDVVPMLTARGTSEFSAIFATILAERNWKKNNS